MKRSYSFLVLLIFAFVMAIVYLASYIGGAIDNSDNISGQWYYLLGGVIYLLAGLLMVYEPKASWYLYMIGLIMTILISLFVDLSLEALPTIVLAVFVMLFLLDDSAKNVFGVDFKFSVKVKL